jgi:heat-inducible transcriptional repressor
MDKRKRNLLKNIISEFYQTAQPVGSSLLVNKYYCDLSSATIRNEMAILEEEKYIIQPYTSAGRVPTEKGYRYYLDNLLQQKKISKNKKNIIDKIFKSKTNNRESIKTISKSVAEITKEMIFVAFDRHDFYYTGISNLLSKPEFRSQDLILNISKVIDHFDEVLENIFNQINSDIDILIGSQNPFSANCAAIIANYKTGNTKQIFGILGPMRMNYQDNKAIIQYFTQLFK